MTQKIKFKGGIIATCMAVLIAMCMTVIISGCTSTELVDAPQSSGTKGQTITLNISCPEAAASTRADNDPHAGHVLRYSAILYSGESLKEGEFVDRQEAIITTGSETSDVSKTFTFKVPEGTYSYVVIADYIPSDFMPDSNGLYGYKYYNTQNPREYIYMYSFIDFSTFGNGNKEVKYNCFNNENYDCFANYDENIVKTSEDRTETIELQRIVSRVAFKSTTPLPENTSIESITFSNLDFFGTHTIKYRSISGQHAGSTGVNGLNLPSQTLDYTNNEKRDTYNADTDELFFFYTFASDKEGQDVSLYEFEFTVKFNDGSSFEYSGMPRYTIKPTPNYKIVVKGPFLSNPIPTEGYLNLYIPNQEFLEWGGEKEI